MTVSETVRVRDSSDSFHLSATESALQTTSAGTSSSLIAKELVTIDAARDTYKTLERIFVHQDPVEYAQRLIKYIPANGQGTFPGYWPAFKGHHLETLNHDLYNLAHRGTGKYLVFDKPGMAKWDGSFYIDDRFAGKFQVKFGADSIKKAINKMKAEGCNPKKATLFVPKDKFELAQQAANGDITVKAISLTSDAADNHAQLGIKKIAKSCCIPSPDYIALQHLKMLSGSVIGSVGFGAIHDEIQIARGKQTRHYYWDRRKNDVIRGGISYAGAVIAKAGLKTCAGYGLRFAATRGLAAAALTNPIFAIGASFVATGLLTKLWRKIF